LCNHKIAKEDHMLIDAVMINVTNPGSEFVVGRSFRVVRGFIGPCYTANADCRNTVFGAKRGASYYEIMERRNWSRVLKKSQIKPLLEARLIVS